jgi:hypothetical protein
MADAWKQSFSPPLLRYDRMTPFFRVIHTEY